jgi:hypothetical protein
MTVDARGEIATHESMARREIVTFFTAASSTSICTSPGAHAILSRTE